jgi:type II secretory pathway pseudopilin PulG
MKANGIHRWWLEEGCSLIETLVAMAVLSVILMGVVSMFAVSQAGIADGAKSLETSALVETKIERLRSIPYHELLAPHLQGEGEADLVLEDTGSGGFSARQRVRGVNLSWSVNPDGPLNKSRAATIRVTAEWVDARGQHRTIRFGTRRANPVYSGATTTAGEGPVLLDPPPEPTMAGEGPVLLDPPPEPT